jgi:hypothetical protein
MGKSPALKIPVFLSKNVLNFNTTVLEYAVLSSGLLHYREEGSSNFL